MPAQLLAAIAPKVIDTAIGMALESHNDKRQGRQFDRMAAKQLYWNKQQMDYEQQKQLETWEKTGYPAQKRLMQEAGLNPGLMYGMSGGGGQTTGNAGGNVSTPQVPTGGQEVTGMMGMGIQSALAQANIELMKSQANKNNVDAAKTAGVDTTKTQAEIENIQQGIDNQRWSVELMKLDKAIKEIQRYTQEQTIQDQIETIRYNARIAAQQLNIIASDAKVQGATIDERINIIKQEAINKTIEAMVMKAGINKTTEEIKQISAEIQQNWQKLSIEQFKANFEAKFPGIGQTLGRAFNDGIESIFKVLGLQRIPHNQMQK